MGALEMFFMIIINSDTGVAQRNERHSSGDHSCDSLSPYNGLQPQPVYRPRTASSGKQPSVYCISSTDCFSVSESRATRRQSCWGRSPPSRPPSRFSASLDTVYCRQPVRINEVGVGGGGGGGGAVIPRDHTGACKYLQTEFVAKQ